MNGLENYITVAERVAEFTRRYPDGSLQMDPPEVRDIAGRTFLVAQARAYRTPDDPAPGVGTAWEPVPGSGAARGSELMVLETSCWGRAIVALGITADRGIASREEIRAASERPDYPEPATSQPRPQRTDGPPPLHGPAARHQARTNAGQPSEKQQRFAGSLFRELGLEGDDARRFVTDVAGIDLTGRSFTDLTRGELSTVIDELTAERDRLAAPITRTTADEYATEPDPWATSPDEPGF